MRVPANARCAVGLSALRREGGEGGRAVRQTSGCQGYGEEANEEAVQSRRADTHSAGVE